MKLTVAATIVKQMIASMRQSITFDDDMNVSIKAYGRYIKDMPSIGAEDFEKSAEDLNELCADVMKWVKSLANKRSGLSLTTLQNQMCISHLLHAVTTLHLQMEQVLHTAGLVEQVELEDGKVRL